MISGGSVAIFAKPDLNRKAESLGWGCPAPGSTVKVLDITRLSAGYNFAKIEFPENPFGYTFVNLEALVEKPQYKRNLPSWF